MDEEKKNRCLAAWVASYNLLLKECGGKRVIPVPITEDHPVLVFAPNPSPDPGEHLTVEERIKAIEQSTWAQHLAEGMCSKLFGVEPGTEEFKKCVERVAHKVAEGMVLH